VPSGGNVNQGIAYAFIGALSHLFGNIVSARNSKIGIPVVQSNAFGMFYGALFIFLLVLGFNKPITMSQQCSYIFSLTYLALFGSVIAFGAYLTLIGHIGADKAGYTTLVIPVIALFLSTIFEGYRWSLSSGAGVVLVVFGNLIIMKKKQKAVIVQDSTDFTVVKFQFCFNITNCLSYFFITGHHIFCRADCMNNGAMVSSAEMQTEGLE